MFVNGSEINEQLYRGPPKDASYQILIHLAKRFQRRLFRNQPIRNKNCLWRTCLLMDWDEMSNRYRKPAIDASYQVLLHLAEGFQRRRLKCEKLTTMDAKWWQKLTLPLARWAKKCAVDSQPQVIKFTSCLPVVGGSLRHLSPLKLVAMI